MNLGHTLASLGEVVVVGLLFGAGLPAIFALGMRSLSFGKGADPDAAASPIGVAGALVCFAIVAAAIVCGILLISSDFLASTLGIHVF